MRRTFGTAALLGALLFSLAWGKAEPQRAKAGKGKTTPAANYGNADAITEDELRSYEYFLASDQLEGRNLPSRGYDTAALYIAGYLKEWGVKPGGSAAAAEGPLQPYLMSFDLVSNQLDAAGMKLTLVSPPPARGGRGGPGGPPGFAGARGAGPAASGPTSFEYPTDWIVGSGGGRGGSTPEPAEISGAKLVFVGNGYVINKTNINPYQGIDVRGKIMVVAGVPAELAAQRAAMAGGRGPGGPPANPLGTENVDFTTPQAYAVKNGAAGVIMIPTFQQLSAMATPSTGRGAGLNGPPYQVVKFQNRAPAVPLITAGLELTNAIFQGEKLGATQVFEGAVSNARLEPFELNPEKKIDLKISVTSERNHAENVFGIVEGGDPVLKNEYVVISAHLDHVGFQAPVNGDSIANGADDDASGCAALMAIARAYAEGAAKGMRPKRTMIFLWVAGEEKGLWGSRYFCQFPPVDISKVVLNLNMDMIGRHKTPGYVDPPQYKLVEDNEIFVVGPNISSDEIGKIVETVNGSYQKMSINHFYDVTAPDETHDNLGPQPNGQRIFYRSDHYNFAKMGIPVAFFCDGLHSDYHRVTDSPDRLDYLMMQKVARTVAAVGWVVANQAAPPKLNTNLPERLVDDMKTVKEQGWGKLTPLTP
jgi:Zn-dependent M28 family amino/carboxypeptidase